MTYLPNLTSRELREYLGRHVRLTWILWAMEQPDPKPSWLAPWEQLTEPEKEVDRRIGCALFQMGQNALADELRAHKLHCPDCDPAFGCWSKDEPCRKIPLRPRP